MKVRFAKKTELKDISNLNSIFVKENCCNNIVADSEEYYANKKILVAVGDNKIIGYAYGDFSKETSTRSYAKANDKFLSWKKCMFCQNLEI